MTCPLSVVVVVVILAPHFLSVILKLSPGHRINHEGCVIPEWIYGVSLPESPGFVEKASKGGGGLDRLFQGFLKRRDLDLERKACVMISRAA